MKRKRSTRDVELRLSRMKIAAGDLVLVKGKGVIDNKSRAAIVRALAAIAPRSHVMFLPHGLDMDGITEKEMGDEGWYRKDERVDAKNIVKTKAKEHRDLMKRLGLKR